MADDRPRPLTPTLSHEGRGGLTGFAATAVTDNHYPHKRLLAIAAPSLSARNFAQTMLSATIGSLRTAVPNLLLCGSWIKTSEALHDMEKAVVTGMRAANALIEERGGIPFAIQPLRRRSTLQRISARLGRRLPTPPTVLGHRREQRIR